MYSLEILDMKKIVTEIKKFNNGKNFLFQITKLKNKQT